MDHTQTALLIAAAALFYIAAFAFGTAFVADSKGRRVGLWMFWGIVLGPIALLIVGIAASAREEAETRAWIRAQGWER